jgi:SAM-dependent methyltransferase
MSETVDVVRKHYGREGLIDGILRALEGAGKDLDALTREDLFTIDEFHIRGRDATRELAHLAGLRERMDVLDVGCGIGGPARTLAAEFGCRVTGIDLVPEYVEAASELTRRVGMADSVRFEVGNALDLPFKDSVFDAVVMEHVSMNVEDKGALFRGIRRVLRPGGIFADYVICAGPESPVIFPVPWSDDGRASFLIPPDEYLRKIAGAGFRVRESADVTETSREWFEVTAAKLAESGPPPLSLGLIMGNSAQIKVANILRNLDERRVSVMQIVSESV